MKDLKKSSNTKSDDVGLEEKKQEKIGRFMVGHHTCETSGF